MITNSSNHFLKLKYLKGQLPSTYSSKSMYGWLKEKGREVQV